MKFLFFMFSIATIFASPRIELGVDVFFQDHLALQLKGKRVGLITNHTGVSSKVISSTVLFKEHAKEYGYTLSAFFAPEHGLNGHIYAGKHVDHDKRFGLPIHSLHGTTRRPTAEMLKNIDVLVYDIQDIGCRAYTYTTTLYYVMEEAAKAGIEVIVLDRPNPMNGMIVDGPMLSDAWRSFLGYVNVPYCHGMTVGELAQFFNAEYHVGCNLHVIPMRGWKRDMTFRDTGLTWIPTSPNVPEPDTPMFCATTGILGELGIVSTGIGYTLPFKIIGAPWINADHFAEKLNAQQFPGVHFLPFHFRPHDGLFKAVDCQGVYLIVTNSVLYRPVAVQYLLVGMLKSLYPKQVEEKLKALSPAKKKLFCQANGNEVMLETIFKERYVAWSLINFQKNEREQFLIIREKYLLY